MGKSKKATVEIGNKKKSLSGQISSSTDSEGDDSGIGLTVSGRSSGGGRSSRGGTIRHVYTANNDMECIDEYLKPTYKDGDVVLDVECGPNKAQMYLSKLCQGSKGPCVHFQESWLTPNEFQYVSGRETAKDWKRSIRHQGKSMKLLLTKGVLSVHSTVCDCEGCRVTSPVNRCRLAEKRRSVYSTTRKERLTLESFTSSDTLSREDVKPEVEDRAEENASNVSHEENDAERPKQKGSKNCSPLRESRLSNIIEQLRTSKEKETTFEDEKIKIEIYNDVKITKDENGNENGADVDEIEVDNEIKVEDTVELPTAEPTTRIIMDGEKGEEGLDVVEESADVQDRLHVTEEPEVSMKAESILEEEDNAQVKIEEEHDATPDLVDSETTDLAEVEPTEEKTEVKETRPKSEDTEIVQESIPLNKAEIPENHPTDRYRKAESMITLQGTETDKVPKPEVKDQDSPQDSRYPSPPPDSQLKAATTDKVYKERRRHSPQKQSNTDAAVKRLSPTAPAQTIPTPVSCPTSIPASIPEQLPFRDMNAVKYSDYIRLLAATHLGGHIPLLQERLFSENFHSLPIASNMGALTHPFPAYPFFAPHLPMKDHSLFLPGPMSIPTMGSPFLPPYMYQPRPCGLLPPSIMDLGKPGHFSHVPETLKAATSNNVSHLERKRSCSEPDSALDLSTKRLKFDGTKLVNTSTGPSGNNWNKIALKPHATCKDKKQSPNRSEKHSANHVIKSNKLTELKSGTNAESKYHYFFDKKSNYRSECTCLSTKKDDIRLWSVQEVCGFLNTLDGCSVYADNFREHRVDGKSLPLLTVEHLMRNIGMKLGPAVLLTETVTRRLKLSKLGYRKCQKCDSKQT